MIRGSEFPFGTMYGRILLSRRRWLETAAAASFIAPFTSTAAALNPNRPSRGGLPVKIEPQMHSDFQAPPKVCWPALVPLHVLLFVEGFEEQRGDDPAPRFWFMNLPEQLYVNQQRWRFQVGQQWQREGARWFYRDCPVRNLLGLWHYVGDHDLILDEFDEKDRPLRGRLGADIWTDETGVHYAVSLRNTTDELWDDVHQWVCFNSYQSPDTGHRPHVRHKDRWLALSKLPGTARHCYLPVEGMVEAYKRSSQFRPELLDNPLSFPGVVAWDLLEDQRKLLTCHYSHQAVCVGTNQGWPCTDLFLWYGRIEPSQEKTCYGHLLFADWDLAEFSRRAKALTLQWQAREKPV